MTSTVPMPANEAERLQALYSLDILDTPPEERFDRLTRLAKLSLDVPVAIIGLIDSDRQWYKSCVGLPGAEVDRGVTFCSHAILRPELMVVEDASRDPRFAGNPAVSGQPFIRFYAGMPVLADGHPVGTLCVADFRPRSLDSAQKEILRTLGSHVEDELKAHELTRLAGALAQSEGTVRRVLESVTDGVITFGSDLVVRSANPAACRIFGSDLIGRELVALMTEPERALAALQSGPDPFVERRSLIGVRTSGHEFPMELSIGEVEGSAGELFVAVARDISARRELEAARERFASTVSHELRTPLTAVRGALEMLAESHEEGAPPAAQEKLVDMARRGAERLGRLVEDVLSLERLRSGRLDFEVGPTTLGPVLEASVEAVEALRAKAGTVIACPSVDHVVAGDHDRLVQVFTNLLGNALKFAPPGSEVEIVVSTREAGWTDVHVVDHGPGIPAEDLERIFEPFEQVLGEAGRASAGTGLGLAISRRIVERVGGTISVESPPGEGATFTVRLKAV